MNKWEYFWLSLSRLRTLSGESKPWFLIHPDGTRVEGQQINAEIQKMGDEGWELVSVVPSSNLSGSGSVWTNELQYIFKRPK